MCVYVCVSVCMSMCVCACAFVRVCVHACEREEKKKVKVVRNLSLSSSSSSQESLLKALKTVCTKNKATLLTPDTNHPPPSPHTITASLLAQCRKKQTDYRVVAMDTTGGVASSLQVDILSELVEIALPVLTPVGWPRGCMIVWENDRMKE